MLSGRHLVVIEDDALMGNSLVQRLELEGADVTWVRREVQGIAAVRSPHRPVDAVICDIRLPDGSGEAIFAAVSRTITPPPFLFITGQGEIDQAVRLLRSGAADYLTKPFEMPDFLKRLGADPAPAHEWRHACADRGLGAGSAGGHPSRQCRNTRSTCTDQGPTWPREGADRSDDP